MQNQSFLTDRQRSELNRTIIAYLRHNKVPPGIVTQVKNVLNGDPLNEGLSAIDFQSGLLLQNGESDNQQIDQYDDNDDQEERIRRQNEEQSEIKKQAQILEKKWTSVVRLQRKVMDLESQVSSLTQELENMPVVLGSSSGGIGGSGGSKLRSNGDPTTWLPRQPPKYSLSGHRQPITAVAFHTVFSILASSSEDGTIKIWDWELGELERTLKGHTKAVLDIDFGGSSTTSSNSSSSNGSNLLLASCSSDLTIKIWDPQNDYSNVRTLTGHDHTISSIKFTPSGTHLISASRDKTIRIWEVKTGYSLRTIQGHSEWVKTVAPSWDSQFVLSAGIDQTARISNILTGESKLTFVGHDHVIECAVFAPKESHHYLAAIEGLKSPAPSSYSQSFEYIATGSRDKTIKIWNTRSEPIITLKGHDNWVRGLTFHPAGRYLLSVSDDRSIRCWDLSQRGRCVKVLQDSHHHFISCIKWAPPISNSNDPTPTTPLSHSANSSNLPGPLEGQNDTEGSPTSSSNNIKASPTSKFKPGIINSPSPSIRSRYGSLIGNSKPGLNGSSFGSNPLTRTTSSRYIPRSASRTSGFGNSLGTNRRVFSSGGTSSGVSGTGGSKLLPSGGANGGESGANSEEGSTEGPGIIGSAAYRTPEKLRNIRCVIATGSVDLEVKIWM